MPAFGEGPCFAGIPALVLYRTQPPVAHPTPTRFTIQNSRIYAQTHTPIADGLLLPADEGTVPWSHEPLHFSSSRHLAYDSHVASRQACSPPFFFSCPVVRNRSGVEAARYTEKVSRQSRPDGATACVCEKDLRALAGCSAATCRIAMVPFGKPCTPAGNGEPPQIAGHSNGIALCRRVVSYPGPSSSCTRRSRWSLGLLQRRPCLAGALVVGTLIRP